MRVWTLLSTIIELLYDDDLLASLAALEDDCNLGFSPLIAWPERYKNEHFSGLVDLKKESVRNYATGNDLEIITFDHLNDLEYVRLLCSRIVLTRRWIASSHPEFAGDNYTVLSRYT